MTARQRGFTLLEVLIALVVLAVGLLGLAALQNLGLRYGNESYERSQATLLIYEMIDRMRANPSGVRGGSYDGFATYTNSPPATSGCTTAICDNNAMAIYDVNQWISAIIGKSILVGGEGRIQRQGTSFSFNVAVQWQEHDQPQTQVVQVQLLQ
jgi:type IV pilus assembly protein PilV